MLNEVKSEIKEEFQGYVDAHNIDAIADIFIEVMADNGLDAETVHVAFNIKMYQKYLDKEGNAKENTQKT